MPCRLYYIVLRDCLLHKRTLFQNFLFIVCDIGTHSNDTSTIPVKMNSAYETIELNELHRDHSKAGASAIENSNINAH